MMALERRRRDVMALPGVAQQSIADQGDLLVGVVGVRVARKWPFPAPANMSGADCCALAMTLMPLSRRRLAGRPLSGRGLDGSLNNTVPIGSKRPPSISAPSATATYYILGF